MAELEVIIHGERAGTVSDRDGRALFSYSDEYLARPSPVPLSTGFPLNSRPHDVEAWLDGLLADNDEVRRRWARITPCRKPTGSPRGAERPTSWAFPVWRHRNGCGACQSESGRPSTQPWALCLPEQRTRHTCPTSRKGSRTEQSQAWRSRVRWHMHHRVLSARVETMRLGGNELSPTL